VVASLRFDVRGSLLKLTDCKYNESPNLKLQTSNLKRFYTDTLKSLNASFKLVFRSVLGLR
jgi:hypothetical protein